MRRVTTITMSAIAALTLFAGCSSDNSKVVGASVPTSTGSAAAGGDAGAAGLPIPDDADSMVDFIASQLEAGGAAVDRGCLKDLMTDPATQAQVQAQSAAIDSALMQKFLACIDLNG